MRKYLIVISIVLSPAGNATEPWDHTPMYFWNDTLTAATAVTELPMITAANWRVCRGLRKQAIAALERLNNPRLGEQVIQLKHDFHVLWANCSNVEAGQKEGRGALRSREFTGDVDLAAVSANFVPSFQKARSVLIELSHEDGRLETLAELAPGAVFDIPYLRDVKRLRLTEKGITFTEQNFRPGKTLKFKITSSFEAHNLEIPASFLVTATDILTGDPMSLITCSGNVVGR